MSATLTAIRGSRLKLREWFRTVLILWHGAFGSASAGWPVRCLRAPRMWRQCTYLGPTCLRCGLTCMLDPHEDSPKPSSERDFVRIAASSRQIFVRQRAVE